MVQLPIYMDNHSTTRVDPCVVEAMLPYWTENFGNAGSTSHAFGHEARQAVEQARESIAASIGAQASEIVFTSGATESNNLAIRGAAFRARRRGDHLVSVATEHKSVLDPLSRLGRRGYEVTTLPVEPFTSKRAGVVDLEQLKESLRGDTLLVTVMLGNSEIGIIQPLAAIAELCKARGVPLHTDAAQAVGKIPVNVDQLGVDLMSFSAHKLYGPKGVGALYVRRKQSQVKLEPQIVGGGQEHGLRSGTLNVPGIVGFARAVELCLAELDQEAERLAGLRTRLFQGIRATIPEVGLNGGSWETAGLRLPGNLNVSFGDVDGEALMMTMRDLAVSSGSACSSAEPDPSHVLKALGLSDDAVRSSLRFGLGRFNTTEEVDYAVGLLSKAVHDLRSLGTMA